MNTGTGCALECPSRGLRSNEYDYIRTSIRVAYWFGVLVGLMQIINLLILKPSRQNMYVLGAVVSIFVNLFIGLVQIEIFASQPDDMICSTNASWYNFSDVGDSLGANICAVSAFTSAYAIVFMYWVSFAFSGWILYKSSTQI